MRAPFSRSRAIAAALAAVAVAVPAAHAQTGHDHDHDLHDRLALSTGHVDAVAPQWDGAALSMSLKDDTRLHHPTSVFRDPDTVLLHVKPEAATVIPASPTYSFLGAAGDTTYILPEVQNPDLLWPGFSSEHSSLAPFAGSTFTWRLVDKEGPGAVALWQSGAFGGANVRFNSADGMPDQFVPGGPGTHAHYNWAFSELGLYTLTFEVKTSGGPTGPVSTGLVEYVFFVGDLADLPEPEPVSTDLTVSGMQASYLPGETVSLAAVQNPVTELDHYHWYRRCASGEEWTVVGGQPTLSFTAAAADHGCQYEVRLFDHDHDVVATSPAVTLNIRDTTPPTITGVPADITTAAAAPAGKAVSYTSPTATDDRDGAVAVTCSPASGSTFPIGATTVTCSAHDAAGNTATKTFKVTVTKVPTALSVKSLISGGLTTAAGTLTANGVPLAGKTVTFTAGDRFLCSGVTAANGYVSCPIPFPAWLASSLLSLGYDGRYAGDATYAAGGGHGGLV